MEREGVGHFRCILALAHHQSLPDGGFSPGDQFRQRARKLPVKENENGGGKAGGVLIGQGGFGAQPEMIDNVFAGAVFHTKRHVLCLAGGGKGERGIVGSEGKEPVHPGGVTVDVALDAERKQHRGGNRHRACQHQNAHQCKDKTAFTSDRHLVSPFP